MTSSIVAQMANPGGSSRRRSPGASSVSAAGSASPSLTENSPTATAFLREAENALGWDPSNDGRQKPYVGRKNEFGVIAVRRRDNPHYTWPNLMVALRWVQRKRFHPLRPADLCWYVDRALEDVEIAAPGSLEVRMHEALTLERDAGMGVWFDWLLRVHSSRVPDLLDRWERERAPLLRGEG